MGKVLEKIIAEQLSELSEIFLKLHKARWELKKKDVLLMR